MLNEMKYNFTIIYKNKDNLLEESIKRVYNNTVLDINTEYDEKSGGYFIIDDNRFISDITDKINLKGKKIFLDLLMTYLGDDLKCLSFVVDILVPKDVMRKLKVDSVL
jgi:hypothetical protein